MTDFATSVYGPSAGTTSTVTAASTGLSLAAYTRVAFVVSAKAHIVFGSSASVAATLNDLPLPANEITWFDVLPSRPFFSVIADTGSITLTWAPVS